MPICIVGDLRDLTAVYMGWLARRRQLDVLELSEDRIGDDWYFGYSDTAPHAGAIWVNGTAYRYAEIQGAYVRLNPHPRPPEGVALEPQEEATLLVERRHGIQHFLNTAPFRVATRLCVPGPGSRVHAAVPDLWPQSGARPGRRLLTRLR